MSDSLLEFPCVFPMKVVGVRSDSLRPAVDAVLANAGADVVSVTERISRSGNYISLTVTVNVESKPELDVLYEQLTDLEGIKWVL